MEEYTYYERTCTAQDITDGFRKGDSNTTVDEALDSLLLHGKALKGLSTAVAPRQCVSCSNLSHSVGATIIPELVRPSSLSNLRRYLQYKNSIIRDEEAYPMSQGYQRLSYGLEPTEDEAVEQAIREITSHPMLPQLLEEVLGVDPALSEITMIASFLGRSQT
jgi:hypothetical protein